MPSSRRLRILARLTADGSVEPGAARLCAVCAEVTAMSGAGIMVISPDLTQGSVCSSDSVSALIEELHYTLGEGPCIDAYRQAEPVLEPDLQRPAMPRWPAFTPAAVGAGVGAIFGFPLRIGGVRLGALNLYRAGSGPLVAEQHADALVVADLASQAVIAMQAHAPPGRLAAELEAGAELRLVVHQASGMVAVQLDVGVAEALLRLRAHAFGNERSLTDVARDVVARRLRFNQFGPA